MRSPPHERPWLSTRAVQHLAQCAQAEAVAHTRPLTPHRALDRVLRRYQSLSAPRRPYPPLGPQETLALWQLLAQADTRASLARQAQAGRLCQRWAGAIQRVLCQTVPALSIDQRRLLCEWISYHPDVAICARAARAEQILCLPIYAFQVEVPQPAVVAPPSPHMTSAAERVFACVLSDLGVRYYTAPVCAQSLSQPGPALYPGYAPPEPAPWPVRTGPPSAERA